MDELQIGASNPVEVSSHQTIAVIDAATPEPVPTPGQEDILDALSYDLTCLRSNVDTRIPEPLFLIIKLAAETRATMEKHKSGGDSSFEEILKDVQNDLAGRIAMGECKYGTRLKSFNGRDCLMDLYQELLDGMAYGKQAQLEGKL